MPELPPDGLGIAVDIGRIASAPGTPEDRAGQLLETVGRLVPWRGAFVSAVDLAGREQTPLATIGYDDATCGYMKTPEYVDEIELLGLHRERRAMRMKDMPVPPDQIRGWVEYLQPAGFKEGLGVALFTSDGRYLGLLGLNTDDPRHPTEAARDLIGVLAPVIADAVDPLRSMTTVARMVRDTLAGVALTSDGQVLRLPGLPTHSLLAPGSEALGVAEKLSHEIAHGSFLYPLPDGESLDGHARLTVLACPPQAPYRLAAVVLVSPTGETHGLTRRELQIAGLLIEGWPNQRIAAALYIADRTVATHVEHILAKLHAPTRALAAVRALRYGLYVPRLE